MMMIFISVSHCIVYHLIVLHQPLRSHVTNPKKFTKMSDNLVTAVQSRQFEWHSILKLGTLSNFRRGSMIFPFVRPAREISRSHDLLTIGVKIKEHVLLEIQFLKPSNLTDPATFYTNEHSKNGILKLINY